MVKENIEFFLNEKSEKGLLYEEDVNEIKKMYNELKMYTYRDIFDNRKIRYKRLKKITKNTDFDMENKNIYAYGVLEPFNDKIIKIINIHREYFHKNEVCINFLIEIYFQKLAKTYINDEKVIIPTIYKYGYINGETHILYFFEMDYYIENYYENIIIDKELKHLINKVEINNEKINMILRRFINYKNGINYLKYIETKYNIYHNDVYLIDEEYNNKLIEKIKKCKVVDKSFNDKIDNLISNITTIEFEPNNLLSNNLQCIIIDFGCCSRKLEK
jgi:hypothetical protein